MLNGTFTYESGPGDYEEFPHSESPVYILGEVYSAQYDRDELLDDIRSRLWVTYRRNFPSIGGTGPTSDQGWGCMLRCGQMMLAQALVLRHLGRNWRWNPDHTDDKYWKLLRLFEDKKACIYSIHQIASMGEAEGKNVGQWFGPNTISQVLKRISVYDKWSNIAIHVALDNIVVINEIRETCTNPPPPPSHGDLTDLPEGTVFSSFVNAPQATCHGESLKWRPLLLMIPLRLGLTDINSIYFDSLKKCLMMRQSVGIIGGKPNHAHWFIGFFGNELIFLDPHTTQLTVDLDGRGASDASYHCPAPPQRMPFSKLDPSIALGFYCDTEHEFSSLCNSFSSLPQDSKAMFEVRKDMPSAWPSAGASVQLGSVRHRTASLSDFSEFPPNSPGSGDDEEFEII